MNLNKQIEACARLEGYVLDVETNRGWKNGSWCRQEVPTYDSHDDLQRLIDGLEIGYMWEESGKELAMYDHFLVMAINHPTGLGIAQHRATPAQKREALLKAKGLWE